MSDGQGGATDEVQRLTGRQFVPARFRLTLREFPACLIRLPRSPLLAVEDVQYRDTNGDLQPLTNEVDYFVDDAAEPATVQPVVRWPATYDAPDAVQITFRAGYEATESPTEPAPPPPRALVAIKSLAA
jgi:hypothetical protein